MKNRNIPATCYFGPIGVVWSTPRSDRAKVGGEGPQEMWLWHGGGSGCKAKHQGLTHSPATFLERGHFKAHVLLLFLQLFFYSFTEHPSPRRTKDLWFAMLSSLIECLFLWSLPGIFHCLSFDVYFLVHYFSYGRYTIVIQRTVQNSNKINGKVEDLWAEWVFLYINTQSALSVLLSLQLLNVNNWGSPNVQ